jgi:hypothetical protein
MYDYFLGGNHNFEVDRQAADQVIKALPFIVKYARLQRWALQDIARELTINRGYDAIIDFASGLPTGDHIHTVVPKGTTVIYSDYDPVVVAYAHEILEGTPDVYFFEYDVTRPEEMLESVEVKKILGGRRKVGISFWGISGFLYDDELARSMQVLYDWAAPGSCMAFNPQVMDIDVNSTAIIELFEIYARFGQDNHPRTSELFNRLIKPWHLDEKGWISLLDWHGFDKSELAKEDAEAWGPMGGGFGAYLTK